MTAPVHLGLDVGGSSIKIVAVDPDGTVLRHDRLEIDPRRHPAEAAERVAARVADLAPATIGIGSAGTIDAAAGVVLESPNLPGWSGVAVRDLFSTSLGRPLAIDNDANCAAIGEHWLGAGRGARSVVVVTLGTGIGGGIVLEDRIWRGASGTAGEIGHVPILADGGPPCPCGSRGCLETLASATAIVRLAGERLAAGEASRIRPGAFTAQDVAAAARAGDDLARRVMESAGRHLGIGLAVLVNLVNPERVVLVGGLAGAWDLLEDSTRRALSRAAFRRPVAAVSVVLGTLGELAGAIGAARLGML